MNKVTVTLILLIALILAGCSNGGVPTTPTNANPNNLSQAQSQQLATEAFTEQSAAMLNAFQSAKSTCTSSPCPISFTYNCAGGGSIAVAGSLNVSLSGSTVSATGTVTETPSNCSDGTLVINGNPNVTIAVQASDNKTTSTATFGIQGNVSFSPVQSGQFPPGTCAISNLNVTGSANDSTRAVTCSISGSMCGETVSTSCPSGTTL